MTKNKNFVVTVINASGVVVNTYTTQDASLDSVRSNTKLLPNQDVLITEVKPDSVISCDCKPDLYELCLGGTNE